MKTTKITDLQTKYCGNSAKDDNLAGLLFELATDYDRDIANYHAALTGTPIVSAQETFEVGVIMTICVILEARSAGHLNDLLQIAQEISER